MRLSKEKHILILIGIGLALLPLMLMRDFTPSNELRYLSIADEALRNHTFFAFTNHGVPYADKPPFYLWLVMLLRSIFGNHLSFALSLLSVVPAFLIVKIMDTWSREEMDVDGRQSAKLMLFSSAFFIGTALTIRMDMLMCLFIVLALRSFWRIYTEESTCSRRERWLFPSYVFLALFTKGPLGVLIPLCATIAYLLINRQAKHIFHFWGWRTWTILVAGCALWWGLTYMEGGASYLHNLLFHQTIDRAVNSFHHNHPWYFYLICMWYCLAPWSIYVIFAIVSSLRKRVVRSPLHTFFLVTSITTLVLLSVISSKLQVYMLPAIPFMVYAAVIYQPRAAKEKWYKTSLAIPAGIFTLSLPALIIADVMGALGNLSLPLWGHVLFYISATILTYSGIRSLLHTDKTAGQLTAGLFIATFFGSFTIPLFNPQIGYADVCQKVKALSQQTGIRQIATWQLKNASDMDVYLGHEPIIIPEDANPEAYLHQPTILIMPDQSIKIIKK